MITVSHTIRLLGPMSHGDPGAESGNTIRFRRMPAVGPDGHPVLIPALSAGALRGVVRRLLWRESFDLVGLSRETLPEGQWDRLYAALANGGHIEKAETTVRPDAIRARRTAMPVLSLLGAALYSSHMAGRARVQTSWLVCREAALAGLVQGDGVPLRSLMADEARVRHVDREEQDPDVSGVTPMPTRVETVITGALMQGQAAVTGDVERSAWAHGLDLVTHLGGKGGQGFGAVEIEHDGDGSAYVAWLDEHADELREALVTLAEELGKSTSKRAKAARKRKPKPKKPKPDPIPQGSF